MTIEHSTLTKGQVRKLNALRKSFGDGIGNEAFAKWIKTQFKKPKEVRDPVEEALVAALDHLKDEKGFCLGARGYVGRLGRGKGASGFVAQNLI
jgi:hypothetical protein